MNFHEAQQLFVSFIKSAGSNVNAYLWRLSGDAPNNFDMLMMLCESHLDWVPYRLNLRPERFIKIGHGAEELRPKDFYDTSGSLRLYPVDDEHVPTLRTKSQRSVLMQLVAAGRSAAATMLKLDCIAQSRLCLVHTCMSGP